jgi:hypothetical protein
MGGFLVQPTPRKNMCGENAFIRKRFLIGFIIRVINLLAQISIAMSAVVCVAKSPSVNFSLGRTYKRDE